jgi:hypothetical protein
MFEKEKLWQAREEQEVRRRKDDDDSDESGEDSYDWEDDRERWTKMKPLELPPPDRPHKGIFIFISYFFYIIIKLYSYFFAGFVKTVDTPNPPPPSEAAQMARYVVHHSGILL